VISASAPGKLNLFFEVGGLRPDGYHPVVSVYQSLAIRQRVAVEQNEYWQVITEGDLPKSQLDLVPTDEENLVVKAALALAEHCHISSPQKMRFHTYKQVPVAAGLAGGSADAAAALLALNQAWRTGLSAEELMKVAAKVGSDVPFSLFGGTALGVDTGIDLEVLPQAKEHHVVLLVSPIGLGTGGVFKKFDELFPDGDMTLTAADVKQQLADGTLQLGRNSLTAPALELRPELARYFELVPGIKGHMTGSGPTVYFLAEEAAVAEELTATLRQLGHFVILTSFGTEGAKLD
jgi:4-diphosphocytidyl-2-C-methyl-D-erythritol kinase